MHIPISNSNPSSRAYMAGQVTSIRITCAGGDEAKVAQGSV